MFIGKPNKKSADPEGVVHTTGGPARNAIANSLFSCCMLATESSCRFLKWSSIICFKEMLEGKMPLDVLF